MRAFPLSAVLCAGAAIAGTAELDRREPPDQPGAPHGLAPIVLQHFAGDPLADPRAFVAGAALDRLAWQHDGPAFPGDRAGSLRAEYDASLPAGLFGFDLPRPFDQDDRFVAAAIFVVESEGFSADPAGFFQISWGLWSSATTGLDRTGSFDDFAADTFDLVEFGYFPNVSPFFGGPFLGPAVFGTAAPDEPGFDLLGAFANAAFLFDLEAGLPFDVPLVAVLRHRPGVHVVETQVHRIDEGGSTVPVNGAVGVVELRQLPRRVFEVDTVGLTLWHDGFGGAVPALRATAVFHAVYARAGTSLPGVPF